MAGISRRRETAFFRRLYAYSPLQCIVYFLPVTGFTVRRRIVVILHIPGFAVGNQTPALAAGHKVFLPAGRAKIIPVIALIVTVPVAESAVVTDKGFLIGTVTAKELISYTVDFIAVDLGTAAYTGQCFVHRSFLSWSSQLSSFRLVIMVVTTATVKATSASATLSEMRKSSAQVHRKGLLAK